MPWHHGAGYSPIREELAWHANEEEPGVDDTAGEARYNSGDQPIQPTTARMMTVAPATPTSIAVIVLGENRSMYRATPGPLA
jgi:hypothetical protein